MCYIYILAKYSAKLIQQKKGNTKMKRVHIFIQNIHAPVS